MVGDGLLAHPKWTMNGGDRVDADGIPLNHAFWWKAQFSGQMDGLRPRTAYGSHAMQGSDQDRPNWTLAEDRLGNAAFCS